MSVVYVRAPLRISLGGGGTDLPSYFRERGGLVVSASIDKHVHVIAGTAFQERFRLKHLSWEEVDSADEVEHPILRAALTEHWTGVPLELASVADAPPGTGLGSSGAYAVAVLKALALLRGEDRDAPALARDACVLEIEKLGRHVGKQDQYAAAHGGANAWTFHEDDSVSAHPLSLSPETRHAFHENFLLFYTGRRRSASGQLAEQARRIASDSSLAASLDRTRELAADTAAALEAGDLQGYAAVMNQQWEVKARRSKPGEEIVSLRDRALAGGAAGVMLMGAGGGGFLLTYATDPARLRRAMEGTPELKFGLDEAGAVQR